MNQLCAKIYYLISTGEVLTITSEMQGRVESTTKEKDIEIYPQLKDKPRDEVDFIELEYGTLASTFENAKSYSVDVKNKKLNCVYYTEEEIKDIQEQYKQQTQEEQEVNSRVSNISEYLNQDTSSISYIEDYILEIEQNKILNGGI